MPRHAVCGGHVLQAPCDVAVGEIRQGAGIGLAAMRRIQYGAYEVLFFQMGVEESEVDMRGKELLQLICSIIDEESVDNIHKDEHGKWRIVVLQRGWVAVGRLFKHGNNCILENASVIRRWGTTKGLGEIALNGPTEKTVLDKCSNLRFHELGIMEIDGYGNGYGAGYGDGDGYG